MNKDVRFEQLTSIDNTISIEKLVQSSSTHEPVIGKVILYDPTLERFEVNLGNGLSGILPLVDSTVYPLLLPNGELSKSLQYIVGKKIIVTVKSVTFEPKGNPTIVLSRKDSMLDSFNTISNLIGNVIECCITAFSTFGIFVDIGNGICGLIHHKNLCLPRIYDFKNLGINVGDTITAKVISVDDNFHVVLNYKDQFENLSFALKQNERWQTNNEPKNSPFTSIIHHVLMFVGLGILLLSLLFDVEDLFAVVITAGLTYSVRHFEFVTMWTFYHVWSFELPVSTSFITSCF